VLDVNYLKETNDRYGHEVGNKLIVTASRIISTTFKRSPVFRIGGDEFLVILQNSDLKDCEELIEKFDSECANAVVKADAVDVAVSVAKGLAMYDSDRDSQFMDVFNRADNAMYENKRGMKAAQV
jgi:diguanylate cyclase (GGDEF)-like protein